MQRRGKLIEGAMAGRAREFLSTGELGAHRRDTAGGESLVALELVEKGARYREARGPDQLRLALDIEVLEVDQLRRLELVAREEAARLQLENVEPARDLGAHDVAVVPVRRPGAGVDQLGGVHGAAIEEGDLPGMGGVGPFEHRNAALIPGLHHE